MDAKSHYGFLRSPQQHLRDRQRVRDRPYTLKEMTCVAVKRLCGTGHKCPGEAVKDPRECASNNSPKG